MILPSPIFVDRFMFSDLNGKKLYDEDVNELDAFLYTSPIIDGHFLLSDENSSETIH